VPRSATNPEIAESLYVSERTVKGHISGIFTKLGVRDRAAAIICAYDAGLVNPAADRGAGRRGSRCLRADGKGAFRPRQTHLNRHVRSRSGRALSRVRSTTPRREDAHGG
jgi:Bacterial regulatory proteins, luxR family